MLDNAVNYLKNQGIEKVDIGIILGSGLGNIKNLIKDGLEIRYEDIPQMPKSTVKGHDGSILYGKVQNLNTMIFSGRFHYYEGYSLDEVTSLVHLLAKFNAKSLIVSNAAGAVNENYEPGDIVLLEDHINLTGLNPLISENIEKTNDRFVDMTNAYNEDYREEFTRIAKDLDVDIKTGSYFWMTGPSYETKAEIKAIKNLGGDLAGMSTVPEVILANYYGIKVLGISCVTNMAAGLQSDLNHDEVLNSNFNFDKKIIPVLERFVEKI